MIHFNVISNRNVLYSDAYTSTCTFGTKHGIMNHNLRYSFKIHFHSHSSSVGDKFPWFAICQFLLIHFFDELFLFHNYLLVHYFLPVIECRIYKKNQSRTIFSSNHFKKKVNNRKCGHSAILPFWVDVME